MVVIKRNGSKQSFDIEKVIAAVDKAFIATGHDPESPSLDMVSLYTDIRSEYKEMEQKDPDIEVHVEEIQDSVEKFLMGHGCFDTAKAYILYRDQHRRTRNAVSVRDTIEEYISHADWRIKANSNQQYSLGGLILNTAGKVTANYWLNEVYPKEIGERHRDGSYHIHDLDMLSGYCCGHSLRALLEEGFNGITGKISSTPPKHFSTACGQIVNFLGCLQNEWAGAQAFSSFDTYMAPFVYLDNLSLDQVKKELESMIFSLNVGSRWGSQCPFTNITFDLKCPEDLKKKHPIIGGVEMEDKTYGDFQKEMDMINRAFMEVMTQGDKDGRVFTFPIPTYNITDGFNWDHPNCEYLFKMTAKYGNPYFSNYLNSDLKPTDIRSMCCRLRLDLRELLKRGNGLFGSAEQTGSIGVVTINMARLGYKHKGDTEGFYKELDHLLELAKTSLELKRKFITKMLDEGLYPYTKRYLGSFRNFFSTIGVNGMNEMVRNFTDDTDSIITAFGEKFCVEVLDHIRDKMTDFQEETGNLYNLEATPAEGATYRFAKEDIKRYPDIIHAGTEDNPYYTNSSQLPVGFTDDPFEALSRQEELQCKYTGGTVLHLYINEEISSWQSCRNIVRKSLENFRLPYISITPTFSICPKHGYIPGKHETCPICDQEIIEKYYKEYKCNCNN